MEIKASLFKISIASALSNAGGRSLSIATKAEKIPTTGDVRLSYLYYQETPEPNMTDESSHLGSASLIFENGKWTLAEGEYWTRRKWREGMNTAGHLCLNKVEERLDPKKKTLRTYALESAKR